MPEWSEEIRRRLRGARLRGPAEADVLEELSQHLDDRYAELRARGLTEDDARAAALDELADESSLERGLRGATRAPAESPVPGAPRPRGLFAGVLADIRHALRVMRRAPGVAAIAVIVTALGVGTSTALFSALNAVLMRPLPGVAAPHELVSIYTSDYSGPRFGASSLPDAEAMRASVAFAGLAAHRPTLFSVSADGVPFSTLGEAVTAEYFDVLGVRAAQGRFFATDESGPVPLVVISHHFWRERLGGAPVLGRTLRVDGRVLTIIGIAPPEFRGMLRGTSTGLWVPLATAAPGDANHRGSRGLFVTARLPDGATVQAVQARLNAVAAALHAEYPEQWTDVNGQSRVLTVLPESQTRVPPQMRSALPAIYAFVFGAVGVALLIACTNVASLLLARATARWPELGVRIALGATRPRIVQQLLVESLILATLGGAAGILLAWWLTQAVNRLPLPIPVPVRLDIAMDVRVLTFAVAITALTGILFGLAPASQAGRAPAPMMKGGARSGSRQRLRDFLVVSQVAVSVVLLAGAALCTRSLMAAQSIETGVGAEHVALMYFDLGAENYTPEQARLYFDNLQQRVAGLPGVTGVVLADDVPLDLGASRTNIAIEGYTPTAGENMEVYSANVGAGYFDVMGIRVVRGRGFTEADREGAIPVAVVNEAFAHRYWPDLDPIGQRIGLFGADGPMSEVVGVVSTGRYNSLSEDPTPFFYFPYAQNPSTAMMLHVRTAEPPVRIAPMLRNEVQALDPDLPVPAMVSLRSQMGLATLPQRIAAAVLGLLGCIVLGIAGIGLYGLVSFAVARRTRELGIRTALGAATSDLRRLVVGEGMRLAVVGTVIGGVIAAALAQLARSFLIVSPVDPLALVAVLGVITAAVGLACYLPARRATRMDPLTALRTE